MLLCGFPGCRYRLYMEGYAWSVSMKYILACSPTPIFIEPFHWDFFSRALVENKHYVRVPYTTIGARPSPMCKLINVRCATVRIHVRSWLCTH